MKLPLRAAALATVLSWVGAAAAQPSAQAIRRAAESFDQGRDAYKAGSYAEAGEHFESADAYAPSNKALEFAIRSRRNAGQLDRAATLAELVLSRYPNDENLKLLADEVLAEAAAQLHRVAVTCDNPCDLVVGTTLVAGKAGTQRVIYLEPGEHAVRASFTPAGTVSKTVVAVPGGQSELAYQQPGRLADAPPSVTLDADADFDDFEEADEAVDRGPTEEPYEGLPQAVFWGGLGLTAVGIGLSVWSYVDLLDNPGEDAVRNDCRGLDEDCDTWKEAKANELRTNIIIGATTAVGVATIVIGAAFTDWGGNHSPEAEKKRDEAGRTLPSVHPWVGTGASGGAMVGAYGRF
jgi:tetratricopeptide (TPR) repeat protein